MLLSTTGWPFWGCSKSWDIFWAEDFSGKNLFLGGGFKYVLFSPLFGEDFQFDSYFSDGLKPPTSHLFPGHLNLVLSILVKNATEVPLPNWARVPQRREENSCLDQDGNRNVPKKEMLYYWIIK